MYPLIFFSFLGIAIALIGASLHTRTNDTSITYISRKGCITKIDYSGHTYIAWTCNMGCSMVHDPDCKCNDFAEKKNVAK
jgi:hypothetical protein